MDMTHLVERLLAHRRAVIVLLLVVTAGFGAGATLLEEETSIDGWETESTEGEKLTYIQENYAAEENTTVAQVIIQGDNVLDSESLIDALDYQLALLDAETVNSTLVDDPISGVPNAIAIAGIHEQRAQALQERQNELNATEHALTAALEDIQAGEQSIETAFVRVEANTTIEFSADQFQTFTAAGETLHSTSNQTVIENAYLEGTQGVLAPEYETLRAQERELAAGLDPTLAEQRDQLAAMSDDEIEATVETVLDTDDQQLLALLPATFETGETQAEAVGMSVLQDTGGEFLAPDMAPQEIIDVQHEMQAIAEEMPGEYLVFGHGITADEVDRSMEESLAVVGPLALLFVLTVLLIAYRDPLDIALGFFGIVAVLIWTFGFMGLTGIDFEMIFIAVPVLLIGLSIDYAIHVFMRGREAREGTDSSVEAATIAGLGGVAFALVLVTVTAAVGFLSNIVSPVDPIQRFGIVNAFGITAALVIFGLLVPAMKIEIDSALERRGYDRRKRAFGTSGRLEPILRTGELLARRAPALVLVVVLVLSSGGVYAGTQVDTTFTTDDFMADEAPDWTEHLPESMEPDSYTAKATMAYLDETFLRQEMQIQILLEGDPTDDAFLQEAASAERAVGNASTIATLPNGAPAVRGPISTMEQVAAENESFNATYHSADTTGDGIPDTNLDAVYDELFAVDQQRAADILHRAESDTDESARIVAFGDGAVTRGALTTEFRGVAESLDDDVVTATVTGEQTVIYHIISQDILDTVLESLFLTLVAVGILLTVISRMTAGSATLGLVTTAPVVLALTWVLGTMYLLGMSFNSITGMITSLTIGLGVAYSIHVSQRYRQQLERNSSVFGALRTTVTGTGGALLGSAATTAGGFGVLTAAFVPSLQQFGLISALSIIYAFLASVLVLPTLLVIWTRLCGPDWARREIRTGSNYSEAVIEAANDD